MRRWDIVNTLIEKINAKKYLEIGIANNENFSKINCDYKVGVDPDKNVECTHNVTSNEFFANNTEIFDVIFIDGLHHASQVYEDIQNSLNCLSSNGYIVCHDMNPTKEAIQRVPRETDEWTGDCWKAWIKFRMENENLNMFVVDTDYGCGVISRGNQDLLSITTDITYNNLDNNRETWLNLISIEEFKECLG